MRTEIIRYYESRGFHIHKIVRKAPHKIPEDRVWLAIYDVYDEIKNGRQIRDIQLAREIWRKAFDYSDNEINDKTEEIGLVLHPIKLTFWMRFKNVCTRMLRQFLSSD